jgi:hypothetical protein
VNLGTILIPPKILPASNVGKFVSSKTPQPGLPVGIAYDINLPGFDVYFLQIKQGRHHEIQNA